MRFSEAGDIIFSDLFSISLSSYNTIREKLPISTFSQNPTRPSPDLTEDLDI
jgi:hypothetical protein